MNKFKSFFLRLITHKITQTVLGIGISVLSLYLALQNVSLPNMWVGLSQAKWEYVSLALISVAINAWAKAVRWELLLGSRRQGISSAKIFISLLVGQTLNLLLPARLGDLSRVQVIGSLGAGRIFTLGTIAVEKIFDLISYTLLFVLLLFLMPLPAWISESGLSFVGVAVVMIGGIGVITVWRKNIVMIIEQFARLLPDHLQALVLHPIHSVLKSFDIFQDQRSVLHISFWSAVVWGASLLTNQFTMYAVGIDLPVTASLLILIGLQVGITIPSVPGRIGIFEYICMLALTAFDVPQDTALAYSILLHGIAFIPTTLISLLLLPVVGNPLRLDNLTVRTAGWKTAQILAENQDNHDGDKVENHINPRR